MKRARGHLELLVTFSVRPSLDLQTASLGASELAELLKGSQELSEIRERNATHELRTLRHAYLPTLGRNAL